MAESDHVPQKPSPVSQRLSWPRIDKSLWIIAPTSPRLAHTMIYSGLEPPFAQALLMSRNEIPIAALETKDAPRLR